MFFSIIIPVYNVEDYLNECLDSILSQNYTDYEILLVNDGSKDRSGEICNTYAKNNFNIRVFHQENKGVSSARNKGLNYARGKYIFFVDSDDIMCEGALNKVFSMLKKENWPEVLLGNIIHWQDKKEYIVVDNTRYMNPKCTPIEYLCRYADEGVQLPWRPYQLFIKRSVIESNEIRFNNEWNVAEDCDFFIEVMRSIKFVVLTNINLVKYRLFRDNSLVSQVSGKTVMSQLQSFYKQYCIFSNTIYKKSLATYFANRYVNIIILIVKIDNVNEQKKAFDYVRKHKDIIYKTIGVKYSIVKIVWFLFGLKRGTFILNIINNFRNKFRLLL